MGTYTIVTGLMQQQTSSRSIWHSYASIILLLAGITLGSLVGFIYGKQVEGFKFIGDIFLKSALYRHHSFGVFYDCVFHRQSAKNRTTRKVIRHRRWRISDDGHHFWLGDVVGDVVFSDCPR